MIVGSASVYAGCNDCLPTPGKRCHNSSVMHGINGGKNRNACSRPVITLERALFRCSVACSAVTSFLVSSIYQSQKSYQKKRYNVCTASWNWLPASVCFTLTAVLLSREIIQRSCML